MLNKKQQEAIDWALDKIQKHNNNLKYFNWSAIILTAIDIVATIIHWVYATLTVTTFLTSILCGSAWTSRAVQILRMKKLVEALRYPAMLGLAYILTRKKRSEYMQNIKLKNIIIAGVNVLATLLGIILVFVEPNAITSNIEAVIIGVGALLGVNVAIPCFNNAKVSEEEAIERAEIKNLKIAKKQAKANLKAQEMAKLNEEANRILTEQETLEAEDIAQPTEVK